MALGRCRECHHQPLSDSAECCPNCGSTQGPEFYKSTKREAVYQNCPYCEGKGILTPDFWKDKGIRCVPDYEDSPCRFCNGTGKWETGDRKVEIWE